MEGSPREIQAGAAGRIALETETEVELEGAGLPIAGNPRWEFKLSKKMCPSPPKTMIMATMKRTYPGGKAGNGVYQTIINLMPPHKTYIETHLGGGAILKKKRPASRNIGIDLDPEVISSWRGHRDPNLEIYNTDSVSFLKSYPFSGEELVYCDPPYLQETRKTGKIYRFEYTQAQHIRLLECIRQLNCMVLISGYPSSLYDEYLEGWNRIAFQAQTRGGVPATEHVWFNYKEPLELHDTRFLGKNYRERERIKKKAARWVKRFQGLPILEKQAIIRELKEGGVL